MEPMTERQREEYYAQLFAETGQCQEWQGATDSGGYGQVGINGKRHLVHRLAWSQVHGAIPSGLVVRHRCDNKLCTNIDHLELGTQKQNIADAIQRGLYTNAGREKSLQVRQEHARDKAAKIQALREQGRTWRQVAEELGVTVSAAKCVLKRSNQT